MSDNEQILDAARKYLDNKVAAVWDSLKYWETMGTDTPGYKSSLRVWAELDTIKRMLNDPEYAKSILTIWEDYNDRYHGEND